MAGERKLLKKETFSILSTVVQALKHVKRFVLESCPMQRTYFVLVWPHRYGWYLWVRAYCGMVSLKGSL